jgi:transposase-like protein
LKLITEDGKMRETDCADTEGVFRIIQSIPSPKAEPFKHWLAKVGFERIQEIENPELATKRTRMLHKLKGLKKENLRDHMDDFELIFNMLGEKSTTEIHKNEDFCGVEKLKQDAKAGGSIAGSARKQLEEKLGRSIVKKQNFKKLK